MMPCAEYPSIFWLVFIDVSKILTLGELFKVKVIFGAAFHKLKHEQSLKSLTIRCEVIAN